MSVKKRFESETALELGIGDMPHTTPHPARLRGMKDNATVTADGKGTGSDKAGASGG